MARRTLAGTATVAGTGLHTGAKTTVHLGPAEPGSGIRFQRTDLPGTPSSRAPSTRSANPIAVRTQRVRVRSPQDRKSVV